MSSKERIAAMSAAMSASREARIHLQHVERDLKDGLPVDIGDIIEQLAAAQSFVHIALAKLSSWEV